SLAFRSQEHLRRQRRRAPVNEPRARGALEALGSFLAKRAWGTVREDYSADGDAWSYFPHDHARSRAYRWNEDGIAAIADRHQYLCFALALGNGADPILKEPAVWFDYHYVVTDWLEGEPCRAGPAGAAPGRTQPRVDASLHAGRDLDARQVGVPLVRFLGSWFPLHHPCPRRSAARQGADSLDAALLQRLRLHSSITPTSQSSISPPFQFSNFPW